MQGIVLLAFGIGYYSPQVFGKEIDTYIQFFVFGNDIIAEINISFYHYRYFPVIQVRCFYIVNGKVLVAKLQETLDHFLFIICR